jgi:hypothetical protein
VSTHYPPGMDGVELEHLFDPEAIRRTLGGRPRPVGS